MRLAAHRTAISSLIAVCLWSGSGGWSLAEDAVRTVKGTVTAVNLKASPNVLVVSALTAEHKELIVGVTVGSETTITRGGKPAGLSDLRTGESLVLRYVKDASGLAARSIEAQ